MLGRQRAWSASTWSSSTGAARSPWTARSHSLPRPGVPRPSTTTTAKPWSANHCDGQVARCARRPRAGRAGRRRDRAAPAAASRRGRGGAATAVARRRSPTCEDLDVRRHQRPFGQRADDELLRVVGSALGPNGGGRAGLGRASPIGTRSSAPPTTTAWTPGLVDQARRSRSRPIGTRAAPWRRRSGSPRRPRCRRSSPTHGAHLQVGGSDGLAVDEQSACPVTVGGRHEPSVAQQRWNARDEFDPRVVVVVRQHRRLAACRPRRSCRHAAPSTPADRGTGRARSRPRRSNRPRPGRERTRDPNRRSVREPSSRTRCSVTSALAVPAAGYRTVVAAVRGGRGRR